MPLKDKDKRRIYQRQYLIKNRSALKRYHNAFRLERRREIKAFVDWLKSSPCADCGICYSPCVMDFDHVRGSKNFNIARFSSGLSNQDLLIEEIYKCDLVCSNCHRMRTFNRSSR